MKRLTASLALLLLLTVTYAQDISRYEYWTDDDYASRISVEATSTEVMLSISTAQMAAGIHFLNFRALRSDGVWGNFCRYLYYIPTLKATTERSVSVFLQLAAGGKGAVKQPRRFLIGPFPL